MSVAYGFHAGPAKSVVIRCGYCDFTTEGRLEQTRVAFEAHVCGRPPSKPRPAKRRRSGFGFQSS
jgi:hypothetical protein